MITPIPNFWAGFIIGIITTILFLIIINNK